jgi:hypothetical protein
MPTIKVKKNKVLIIIVCITCLVLLIPLIAMQFTDEVNWKAGDFIIAAILLIGTGLIIEFPVRKVKRKTYRLLIVLTVLIILLLIWAELAVGIFNTPLSGS